MKVLGIDPGFGRLGVAVLEKNGSEALLFSTCIETNKEGELADRLAEIENGIKDIIAKWQPDHLAIEKLFFTTNQKTVMQVSEARGVVIASAKNAGLGVYEYTPLQIKVAVTGYGKASKTQVAEMVQKLVRITTSPKHDDEYDAIACGLTHLATIH